MESLRLTSTPKLRIKMDDEQQALKLKTGEEKLLSYKKKKEFPHVSNFLSLPRPTAMSPDARNHEPPS